MNQHPHHDLLNRVIKAIAESENVATYLDRRAWIDDSLIAFNDMLDRDYFPLSAKQLQWVEQVADILGVDTEAPLHAEDVPRGKPVELIVDRMSRPLKPPGR